MWARPALWGEGLGNDPSYPAPLIDMPVSVRRAPYPTTIETLSSQMERDFRGDF